MKKLLIYFPERKILPKGGPSGYLYNLRKGLEEIENDEIQISFYNDGKTSIEENAELKNKVPKRIKDIRRVLKYARYLKRKNAYDENVLKYDFIHFHKTEDLYMAREMMENFKGKIILTSHSPCIAYKEIIARLHPLDYKIFKKQIDKLVKMEEYAFAKADYIIFPCKDAEEPYYNTWQDYGKYREEKKYRYLPTGIIGCKAKEDRKTICEKYGIPEDAFIVSYVGRHNEIKGYDELKRLGEKVLSKNDNIYFLIAGREGPLNGLKHKRWIEVGWTNDPHSIISASDVFVLPNKETYFDLVLLEVMSLGIPVILSNTGGNKYFKKFNSQSLMHYDKIEEVEKIITDFSQNSKEDRHRIGMQNKEIFEENFNEKEFAKEYINLIKNLGE